MAATTKKYTPMKTKMLAYLSVAFFGLLPFNPFAQSQPLEIEPLLLSEKVWVSSNFIESSEYGKCYNSWMFTFFKDGINDTSPNKVIINFCEDGRTKTQVFSWVVREDGIESFLELEGRKGSNSYRVQFSRESERIRMRLQPLRENIKILKYEERVILQTLN